VTIALFKQAKEAFGAGDYQQAVAYFDQALLLRHDLYRVYRFNLFSALAKLKEVESVRGASAWRTTASEASHREAQEEADTSAATQAPVVADTPVEQAPEVNTPKPASTEVGLPEGTVVNPELPTNRD
jgi:hypothetical protein